MASLHKTTSGTSLQARSDFVLSEASNTLPSILQQLGNAYACTSPSKEIHRSVFGIHVFELQSPNARYIAKLIDPQSDSQMQTFAQSSMQQEITTLQAQLPGLSKLHQVICSSDGTPIGVLKEFVYGIPVTEFLKENPDKKDQVKATLTKLLTAWEERGFFLLDTDALNFYIVKSIQAGKTSYSLKLIDGEALSNTQRAVTAGGAFIPCEISAVKDSVELQTAALTSKELVNHILA